MNTTNTTPQQILVYLRASTEDQNALRAKEAIDSFLSGNDKAADRYYSENVSGATLNRPELMKLLDEANKDDILVIEQIDRLTRLEAADWEQLKATIQTKGIHLVSIDLATSHAVLKDSQSNDPFVSGMMKAINGMLLDMLAITARKDYEDRRRRQAEGIAKAKAEGKYTGRKQSPETIKKCRAVLALIGTGKTASEAMDTLGISRGTYYKFLREEKAAAKVVEIVPASIEEAMSPEATTQVKKKKKTKKVDVNHDDVRAYRSNHTQLETAAHFKVSVSTVKRICK